jgi:CheY-like chemotaxis protein
MPRILVVDDDADLREVIALALDGQGHEVDSVDSGQAALEQLAHHAYDLVVCDLHMPDVDGRAIYRVVGRRPSPRPAFLFVTGYAHAKPYEEFIKAAQAPVLAKPFAITVLRGAVRRILTEE